jgi:hypothetical protein
VRARITWSALYSFSAHLALQHPTHQHIHKSSLQIPATNVYQQPHTRTQNAPTSRILRRHEHVLPRPPRVVHPLPSKPSIALTKSVRSRSPPLVGCLAAVIPRGGRRTHGCGWPANTRLLSFRRVFRQMQRACLAAWRRVRGPRRPFWMRAAAGRATVGFAERWRGRA